MTIIQKIYKEVAEELNISEKEVEKIYALYIAAVRKEIKERPEREIYMDYFGKLVPSINKLKKQLRIQFKKRNIPKTKYYLNAVRKLNNSYKIQKHDSKTV